MIRVAHSRTIARILTIAAVLALGAGCSPSEPVQEVALAGGVHISVTSPSVNPGHWAAVIVFKK